MNKARSALDSPVSHAQSDVENDSSDFDDEDFSQYRTPGGTKAFVQQAPRQEVSTNAPSAVPKIEVDVPDLPTPQKEVSLPAKSPHKETITPTPIRQFEEDIPSKLRQLKEL